MNLLRISLLLLFPAALLAQSVESPPHPVWQGGTLLELKVEPLPNPRPTRSHKLIRPTLPADSPFANNIAWHIRCDGKIALTRKATAETEHDVFSPRPGKYSAWLVTHIKGEYHRISNVVEFQPLTISNPAPISPPTGSGAPVTITRPLSKPPEITQLDPKDLIKLKDTKSSTLGTWFITKPMPPPNANWKNLSWIVHLDGEEFSQVSANDAEFKPYMPKKGTYEVWLMAVTDKGRQIVSEPVKFRKVR